MIVNNQKLFDELRSLDLPVGEYAIAASGPLGIRGIRSISDIDIVVSNKLWQELKESYPEEKSGVSKLVISSNIEAFCEGSFTGMRGKKDPTVPQQIASADIIDGLPFVNLDTIIYYKSKMARDKDLKDIELIMQWQAKQK